MSIPNYHEENVRAKNSVWGISKINKLERQPRHLAKQPVHRSLDSPEHQHTATLTLNVLAEYTKADKTNLAIRPWTDIELSLCAALARC